MPDANQFAGHIACSSLSQSEIVVPLLWQERCLGVLDIDSAELSTFDATDAEFLQQVVALLLAQSDLPA